MMRLGLFCEVRRVLSVQVYDEMAAKKAASDPRLKVKDKRVGTASHRRLLTCAQPKYMNQLLAQAKKRKIESDYVNQRIIQKEREAEGEAFQVGCESEARVVTLHRILRLSLLPRTKLNFLNSKQRKRSSALKKSVMV